MLGFGERLADQLRPAGQVLPDRRTQDIAGVGDLGAEVAGQAPAGEPVPPSWPAAARSGYPGGPGGRAGVGEILQPPALGAALQRHDGQGFLLSMWL